MKTNEDGDMSAIRAEEEIARQQHVELPLGYEVSPIASLKPQSS